MVALLPALKEVGKRFEKGDFFVPEMLMSARSMQGALSLLRPLLAARGENIQVDCIFQSYRGVGDVRGNKEDFAAVNHNGFLVIKIEFQRAGKNVGELFVWVRVAGNDGVAGQQDLRDGEVVSADHLSANLGV